MHSRSSDPLAALIPLLRPQAVLSKIVSGAGRWSVRYPPHEHPGFCLMLEGSCFLDADGVGSFELHAGDFVLLPAVPAFTLASDLSITPTPVRPSHRPELRHGTRSGPPSMRQLGGYFRFDRAKGILFSGTPMNALFEYYAGVFNTTGRNGPVNPNNNFLYATRLVTNPLGPIPYSEGDFGPTPKPLVALGMAYAYERVQASEFTSAATAGPNPTDPAMQVLTATGTGQNRVPYLLMIQPYYSKLKNPNDLTVEVNNLETDLTARWLGIDLQFEYFFAFNGNTAGAAAAPGAPFALPQTNFNNHGYYAELGYFLIPRKLQIAGRYSEMTPNDKAYATRPSGTVVTQGQDELLGAVNWYFAEHNLKLQTDFGPVNQYGVKDVAGNITDRHDFRWRVQAQLIF